MLFDNKTHWIGINQRVDFGGEFNKYYAFRKDLILNKKVKESILYITADSRYILWLNGKRIGRGPARSLPEFQVIDKYDVSDYLIKGKNSIAVLVHRFGVSNSFYVNKGRTGLLVYGEIKLQDSSSEIIKTDMSWWVRDADWFCFTPFRTTIQMGFQEIFDANKELPDWQVKNISKKNGWKKAWFLGPFGIYPWSNPEVSRLKNLVEEDLKGKIILSGYNKRNSKIEDSINILNSWIDESFRRQSLSSHLYGDGWIHLRTKSAHDSIITFDYGYVFAGFPEIKIENCKGDEIIDIFYHNSLNSDGIPIPNKGFGELYEGICDRFKCREGNNVWSPFLFRGFRFLTLIFRNFNNLRFRVGVKHYHYPIENNYNFKTDNEVINKIWTTSIRTLKSTMLDAHVDNPWREAGQWISMISSGLAAITSFGEKDLLKNGLISWSRDRYVNGFLAPLTPFEHNFANVIDYSFDWISGLWTYVLNTGDKSIISECSDTLIKLLEVFEEHITIDGLFIPPEGFWVFIDWDDIDRRNYSLSLNLLLLRTYKDAIQLFKYCGYQEEKDKYKSRYNKLKKIIEEQFWSDKFGCWKEYLEPTGKIKKILNKRIQPPNWPNEDFLQRRFTGIGSLQGNALALYLKLGSESKKKRALKYLKKGFDYSQMEVNFFSPLFIEKLFGALFKSDASDLAVEQIFKVFKIELERDGTTWPEIFKRGMELIACDYKDWPISDWAGAQGEGASINYIFHRFIFGIYPIEPGFKKYTFRPNMGFLKHIEGEMPTPYGVFKIICDKEDGFIIARIMVPSDEVEGLAPDTLNGDLEIKAGENIIKWKI